MIGLTATTTDTATTSDTAQRKIPSVIISGVTQQSTAIKRSLQLVLSDSVGNSGSLQILSEIGISTQSDGTLLFNNGKLDTALSQNLKTLSNCWQERIRLRAL